MPDAGRCRRNSVARVRHDRGVVPVGQLRERLQDREDGAVLDLPVQSVGLRGDLEEGADPAGLVANRTRGFQACGEVDASRGVVTQQQAGDSDPDVRLAHIPARQVVVRPVDLLLRRERLDHLQDLRRLRARGGAQVAGTAAFPFLLIKLIPQRDKVFGQPLEVRRGRWFPGPGLKAPGKIGIPGTARGHRLCLAVKHVLDVLVPKLGVCEALQFAAWPDVLEQQRTVP